MIQKLQLTLFPMYFLHIMFSNHIQFNLLSVFR